MAEKQNFRTALGGFNREDVVHFIEYLNKKHGNLINQLTSEKQSIQAELERIRDDLARVKTQLSEKENDTALQEAQEENLRLREQVAQLKLELTQSRENAAQELETYRRAERMERAARERSDLIYRQAVGALGEATTLVDGASQDFAEISQRVANDIVQLRGAVDRSRDALQAATATMYAIRPTEETQE